MTKIGDAPASAAKRFYKLANASDDGVILLDGKPARTRARHPLCASQPALAGLIADEWNSQLDVIDFFKMPMTRYQMTVIDRGGVDAGAWRDATLGYLRTDLICYRAIGPAELVARQAAKWDPLLAWAKTQGVALRTGSGVGYIEQSDDALVAAATMLASAAPAALLAIKTAAEISGSAVIAMALWRRAFAEKALFEASRVDEIFQAEKWGADAEAQARARLLERDFLDAARYLSLAAGAG